MSDEERDIRDFLQAEADRAPKPTGITSATVRRARLKRAGFLTSAILGVAILTGGIALGVTNISNDAPAAPPANNIETPTPTDLNPRVTATIPVGPFPRGAAVGEGAVWVSVDEADEDPSDDPLIRIDPAINQIAAELPLGQAGDVAVGAGAVWVLSHADDIGSVLVRIEPQTNDVSATIPLHCVADLDPPDCFANNVAADEDAVWVTVESDPARAGEVVRIDPSINEIVARIPIVDGKPSDIVTTADAVWVYLRSDVEGASLVRIDPQTNAVIATLLRDELFPGAGGEVAPVVTASEDGAWVVRETLGGPNGSRTTALRIDPHTNEITGESDDLIPEAGSAYPFATDEGGLWFYASADRLIQRLNPQTLQVDESVAVENYGYVIDAVLDDTTGTIWVIGYEHSVTRIDLR